MANVFNFGIGLTVADDATAKVESAMTGMIERADSFANSMTEVANSFDLTGFINDQAFELADATAKIAAQMGLADSATASMNTRIIEMSALTGRNTETFIRLAQALGEAGLQLDDFTNAQQASAAAGAENQAVWGEQEALAGLIDAYGVAAEEAAQFAKGSKLLNVDLKGSLDRMTQLQQVVPGVTGLVAQMPHVIEGAREALVDFGEEITGNGPQMVETISRTGATFAKALGRTAAEAMREAVSSFKAFSGELDSNRRLLLGLNDSVSPAMDAMFELGLSFDEANEMLRKGQKDPAAFAASIKQMADEMSKTPGGAIQAERAMLKLMDSMKGTPVPELLRNQEALNRAMEAQAYVNTAAGKATGAFQATVERMWKTGKVALEVFNNLVKLGKVTIGVFGESILKDVFAGVGDSLKRVNDRIKDFTNYLAENETFQKRIRPIMVGIGKAMLTLSTAASVAVGALGSFKGAAKIADLLKMGKGFTSISKALGFMQARIVGPLTLFTSLKTTISEFGKTLSDPSMTSGDKFIAILKGIAQTAADTFDKLLFGIPSMLTSSFFPGVQGSLRTGVGQMVDTLMSGFKGIDLRVLVRNATTQVIEGVKGMVGMVKEFFSSGQAKEMFFGFAVGLQQLGYALIDIGKDVAGGLTDALLAQFGSSLPEIGALFLNTWLNIKIKASELWFSLKEGVNSFLDGTANAMVIAKAYWYEFYESVAADADLAGKKIYTYFAAGISKIQEGFATFGVNVGMVMESVRNSVLQSGAAMVDNLLQKITDFLTSAAAVAAKIPGAGKIAAGLKGSADQLSQVQAGIRDAAKNEQAASTARMKALADEAAARAAPYQTARAEMAKELAAAQAASEKRKADAQSLARTAIDGQIQAAEAAKAARTSAHEAAISQMNQEISANNQVASAANAALQKKIEEEKVQQNLVKTAEKRAKTEKEVTDAAKEGNKTLAEQCREMSAREARNAELRRKFAGAMSLDGSGAANIGAFRSPAETANPTTAPTAPRPVGRVEPQPSRSSPAPKDPRAAAARVKPKDSGVSLSKDAEKAIMAAADAATGAETVIVVKLDKGLLEKYSNSRNARIISRTGLG